MSVLDVVALWWNPKAHLPKMSVSASHIAQRQDSEIEALRGSLRRSVARVCSVCTDNGKIAGDEHCLNSSCPLREYSELSVKQ